MWDVRPIDEGEVDLYRRRLARAFGGDARDDTEERDRFIDLYGLERTIGVFEADDIVGTAGALPVGLTVPGGAEVAMAGTTIVSVQPTHRRRGALRALMAHHLEDVAQRGEPLAGLWSSESSIYTRFGYGPAVFRHHVSFDSRSLTMNGPEPEGRVRLVDKGEAEPLLRSVHDRVRRSLPGMLTRTDAWWAQKVMRDHDSPGRGGSARRYAVYEEDGGTVDGFATYRQKERWEDFQAKGEITVIELMSATPAARRALWGYLTNIDLFPKLEWWNAPVDDLLAWASANPRRVRRTLSDALWVKLVDVGKALESRSYEYDGALTIEIVDAFQPRSSGTYRFEVSEGHAFCSPTDGPPDLVGDIDVLGHLYLGGGNALAMADAGRLHGSDDSIHLLHRLFRTDRAPWCPDVF